ncbi:MAG TPA: hypothetical protein PKX92_09310 [Edaphocola sp.]|nr:hypothetical protein [Edaphocola sp.]
MPINEISENKLLKSGGYTFKSIGFNDFIIETMERNKAVDKIQMWYSFDSMLGEIGFYRAWLTERGIAALKKRTGSQFGLKDKNIKQIKTTIDTILPLC